jgi:2-oxo-4-hydroxy-4-carboxy--5-ureidoimidazoline (OHCU) decarboxylase
MPDTQTHIWVLRKHPGLAMRSAKETEEAEDENEDEDDM